MATSAARPRFVVGLPNNSISWSRLAAAHLVQETIDLYRQMKVVQRPAPRPIESRQSPLTLVSKTQSERHPQQGIYIDVDD